MPNIGAFIAWGLIAALFIPDGWLGKWGPAATINIMVGPMLKYLLPILIGYTGGKVIGGQKGAVTGALATLGAIIATDKSLFLAAAESGAITMAAAENVTDSTMVIGAMICGPLGGWCIKKFDKTMEGHIPAGFEMVVNNFSVGIIGAILAILSIFVIGPACVTITGVLGAGVHFLVGGTQANATIIAAALRPHQGALCAETGHINTHESGAIESAGHKVLTLPAENGKIPARQIDRYCQDHYDNEAWEHMVQPGMVYLSLPTELGTVYTLAELEEISETCRRWKLPLFVDGARLACGLAASDVTLPDLARLCDVFYLGGTKAGLLFGEAVVITNPALNHDFRYLIKQRGGMLAKGRLLGVQFETFLNNGLFLEIGRQEVAQAMRLREAFLAKGCPLLVDSATNQQFPILTNGAVSVLKHKYSFEVWEKVDGSHTAVRFCTSWSTTDGDVDALIRDIRAL